LLSCPPDVQPRKILPQSEGRIKEYLFVDPEFAAGFGNAVLAAIRKKSDRAKQFDKITLSYKVIGPADRFDYRFDERHGLYLYVREIC